MKTTMSDNKRSRRRGRGALYRYKTKAGERWRWQLYEPVNPSEPDGDVRRVSKGGYRTADDADEGLREALAKIKLHVRAAGAGGTMFGPYASEWLDGLNLAPSTIAGYRRLVRLYLNPSLATTRLDKITPSRLGRLYAALQENGGARGAPISANTVRKAHVVIGAILDAAVDDGLMAVNPARRKRVVKAPTGKQVRAQASEMVTWTAGELRAFLEWDRDCYRDEHYAFWTVLAKTGMRRSEGLALRWSDIDVKGQRIAIRRTADTIVIGTTKPPKSGKSRVVDVDATVIETLRTWKAIKGSISLNLARQDAYLFGDDDGNLINPNRATMRWSVRVAAAQKIMPELPRLPLHGLRHSHATILLAGGVHPKVVQERLGHANISITMEIYSHVTETMQREAVDQFARLFAQS